MQRLIMIAALGLVLAGAALAYAHQTGDPAAAGTQAKPAAQAEDARTEEQKRADRRAANAGITADRAKARAAGNQAKAPEEEEEARSAPKKKP